MIDGDKVYVGTVDNIYKAAIIYDIVSIQTKGLKAKTNFIYRKSELLAILQITNLMNLRDKNDDEMKIQQAQTNKSSMTQSAAKPVESINQKQPN